MHLRQKHVWSGFGVIFTCCVKRLRPQQPLHVQRSDSHCRSLKSFSSIPEHCYRDYCLFCRRVSGQWGSAAVRQSGSSRDRTPSGSAALQSRSRIYPDPHFSPSVSTENSPLHSSLLSRCCSTEWSRWNCPEVRSRRLCRYWSLIIRLTTTSGSPPSPFSVLNFCHLKDSMREGVAGIWGRMRGRGFRIDGRGLLQCGRGQGTTFGNLRAQCHTIWDRIFLDLLIWKLKTTLTVLLWNNFNLEIAKFHN